MRRITLLFIVAVLAAYSCSKKTAPVKTEQPTVVVTPPPADTLKMVADAPVPDAMVTEGKTLFDAKCGRCHAFKQPELYNPHRWTSIMERMAPKAKLTEDEKKNVVAYVHFYAKKD